MMEPVQFLDGLSGYVRSATGGSSDKPIRLATIDPAYDAFVSPYPVGIPLPKVTFEGETTLSGKTYPVAAGYIPSASARVWMVPIGNTYLIAGGATHYAAQGFYNDPGGSDGVDFGGGSYFDTVGGLSLETDGYFAGDVIIDGSATIDGWDPGRGLLYTEERTSSTGTGTSTETLVWSTASIVFPANRAIRVDVALPIQNNTASSWSFPRIRKSTVSGTILREFGRHGNTTASQVFMGPLGSFYFLTGTGGTTTLAITIQANGSATAFFFGSATKGLGSRIDLFDVGPSSQFTAKGNTWPVLF